MHRWYVRLGLCLATRIKVPFAGPRVDNLNCEAVDRHGPTQLQSCWPRGSRVEYLDETGGFAMCPSRSQLKNLVETYSNRVRAVETDK